MLDSKKHVIDQTGHRLELEKAPRRIISTVPSQTELLAYLGLEEEVVGITKFCEYPIEWFRTKTRVGGTKQLKLDLIRELQPDLIIGNKEENTKGEIEALRREFPVWLSDITGLEDALEMIRSVGDLCQRSDRAEQLARDIEEVFDQLQKAEITKNKVAYLIWQNPLMAAANGTFIHSMLLQNGFDNVFADRGRYPEIKSAELRARKPDHIFLSSEPFPFGEKHLAYFREICPTAVIHLVDGTYFSWYGSRMLHAGSYFRKLQDTIL